MSQRRIFNNMGIEAIKEQLINKKNGETSKMTTTATAVSGRNDCLKDEIKPGDRVEFRQYGYDKEFATGKVLKVDNKGLLVRVDHAMRSARIALCDIVKVLNNA